MKNKNIAAILSMILALSFSACSLSGGVTSQPGETQTAAVNTAEAAPSSTVSRRTDVSDDIKAQDACVLAYFDALKKNDADKIIRISSSSMIGEVYNSATDSEFIGKLQSIIATYDLMKSTWQFIYSILSDFKPQSAIPDYSKNTIDEFIQEVDPACLADIKVLTLGTLLKQPQMSEGLGMNNIYQRYCLFSIGDKTFCQLFWLVKFPEGYRLVVIGEYNGYSYNGIANPISREQFEALVDPQTIHDPSQELSSENPEGNVETTFLQKIKETPSPPLNSSKEALTYFAKALGSHDIYAALSVYGIKEIATNYDIYKSSEHLRSFSPYGDYCMIPTYEFYRDINMSLYCSEAAKGIISLMVFFSFDFDLKSEPASADYLSAIQSSYDKLISLKVKRSDVIAKSASEKAHKMLQVQVADLGADDAEHRIVEYIFNNKKFTGAIEFIDYGGNWRIRTLGSTFLGLSVGIPVIPSTEVDYNSYI